MAESTTEQAVKDLTTVYTSLLFDLPLASVRQGTGLAGEKETTEAVWKGYDASVRLATAAIDTLYRSPLFGDAVSRTLNELLRWQRVTNAVSGTVLTGMWRALGVPTVADVRGISDQLHALEARLTEPSTKREIQVLRERGQRLETHVRTPAPTQERSLPVEERAAA
jgi:hypothetical protein